MDDVKELKSEDLEEVSGGVDYGRVLNDPAELECPQCGRKCGRSDTETKSWGAIHYYYRCNHCCIEFKTIEGTSEVWVSKAFDTHNF